MEKKNWEKAFCFLDNCIWIGCVNWSLVRRVNLWPVVNALTNRQKILHITKRDIFQLHSLHIDQEICSRCCGSDVNSVWTCLPWFFSKSLLKRDFLDIYLTTVFGVRNFQNTWSIRVIIFLKMYKILSAFQKCKKKLRKFFLLEIIASELAALNCVY